VNNQVKNNVGNRVKKNVKNSVKNSVKDCVGKRVTSRPPTILFTPLFTAYFTLLFTLALTIAFSSIEAQQPAPLRVPRSVLERYAGEYEQNGSTIKISVSGDTLFREVPGQRVALLPISESLFRMGPIFTAEFVTDAKGEVTQIVSSATVEFRLPRKGSRAAPPAPSPAAVRLPRSVLERYVGTYEYIAGQMSRTDLRIVIRLKGDTLIRMMGAQETVLIPVSETRFQVDGTSLVTEFVVDEAGVTQVLGSGFQQLLARLTIKG
jgi:hypothetical protein